MPTTSLKSVRTVAASIALFFTAAAPALAQDVPPEAIRRVSPIYPHKLLEKGVSGSATIEFVVDTDGTPRDAKIVKATHKDFGAAARDAILLWRFKPGRINGELVRTLVQQEVPFDYEKMQKRRQESKEAGQVEDASTRVREEVTEGNVLVEFVVAPDGRPTQIKVIETTDLSLAIQVVAMVSQWSLDKSLAGKKVRQPFHFSADDVEGEQGVSNNTPRSFAHSASTESLDKDPVALHKIPPVIPRGLPESLKRADVVVEFVINPDGTVASPKIISSPDEKLSQATLDAVIQWRYTPGEKNGNPVICRVQQVIPFHLKGDD